MSIDVKQRRKAESVTLAHLGGIISRRISGSLNRRERFLIIIGAAFMSLAFYFMGVINPLLQENTVLRSRLNTHLQASPAKEREMARDVEMRLMDARRRQEELLARVPTIVDRIAFLEDLVQAASASGAQVHGVKWERVNAGDAQEAGMRAEVRIIGSLEAHRAFIRNWASLKRVSWLESADFVPSSENGAGGWDQTMGTYRLHVAALPLTKIQPGRKHMGDGTRKVR